jgi:hypothetical protein
VAGTLAAAVVEMAAVALVVALVAAAALVSLDAESALRTKTNSGSSSPSSLIVVGCAGVGLQKINP